LLLIAEDAASLHASRRARRDDVSVSFRVFHTAGLGRIIEAHEYWKRKEHFPSEVTITFSSQFEQFYHDIGAQAYIVGYNR